MVWVLFAACAPGPDSEKEVVEPEPAQLISEVVPMALSFGVIGLGEPETLPVTVYNLGDSEMSLVAARSSSSDLKIVAPLNLPIAPDSTATIDVTWAPAVPEDLIATLDLLVSSSEGGGVQEYSLPVTGTAAGPVITLAADDLAFGDVKVGCSDTRVLTITNSGLGELTLESLAFTEGEDLTVAASDGSTAPWTLASYQSLDLVVTYTPTEERDLVSSLQILSDDPVNPLMEVGLTGAGDIETLRSLQFLVPEETNVTALFAVNYVVANGQFRGRFDDSIAVFFDTLKDLGAPYRVAFVISTNGEVRGDVPYVDNTMTTADTIVAVDAMIGQGEGDLDTQLQTLGTAIEANRAWLLDESDDWAESKLNLVGMNNDLEQSSGNWVTYVDNFRSFKQFPEDIAVHAFGGDVPRGCNGAEPFEAFYNAAIETNGLFISICDEDWVPHMEALALAMLGEDPRYFLEEPPIEWTIEVWVDQVPQTTGWTYDAVNNEVVFDETHTPLTGSDVQIDYVVAVECPYVP